MRTRGESVGWCERSKEGRNSSRRFAVEISRQKPRNSPGVAGANDWPGTLRESFQRRGHNAIRSQTPSGCGPTLARAPIHPFAIIECADHHDQLPANSRASPRIHIPPSKANSIRQAHQDGSSKRSWARLRGRCPGSTRHCSRSIVHLRCPGRHTSRHLRQVVGCQGDGRQ